MSRLVEKLSVNISKKEVLKLAMNPGCIVELISLSTAKEPVVAFHAAWVLEHAQAKHPGIFIQYLDQFMRQYTLLTNRSCQRHYTKILMQLLYDQYQQIGQHALLDTVIETTFEWLINRQTPAAVAVNCMDVLFLHSEKQDWIADELKLQIEFLMRYGGAAIQSRGKRILEKLN